MRAPLAHDSEEILMQRGVADRAVLPITATREHPCLNPDDEGGGGIYLAALAADITTP
jgi:hypothetical protein